MKLKKEKNRKIRFVLKLLFISIAFSLVMIYAACFPKTMELLDREVNFLISKTGMELNCMVFSGLSEFSRESADKILYFAEVIRMNTKELLSESPKVPLYVISCAARLPSENFAVTSGFGKRKDPITKNTDEHTGIDIALPKGSDIFAAWPGKVEKIGEDTVYGNYIILEHSDGFFTKYCHLSKINCEKGDFINAEEKIGEAGDSGRTTGSHLHFEVIIGGKNIDPMECFAF